MRFAARNLVAICAIALAVPALAAAQQPAAPVKLDVGRWGGTVVTPDGQVVDVTYDVAMNHDTLGITINAGDHGTFAVSNIKLEAGKLSFTFTPGPVVTCNLTRQDSGVYSGDCSDGSGGAAAQMQMVPPKKENG
jgi:hypothetical protein